MFFFRGLGPEPLATASG
jgi:hypothetical protein